MADGFQVELRGIPELRKAFAEASEHIRKKAVRNALKIAARVIQGEAKSMAPILSVPVAHRKAGTVRKNIVVRPSKFARQGGNEGVFVSVRPLKGASRTKRYGKAGAKNPNDPYYWWFLEFGTKFMNKRPFMGPAATRKGEEAITKFMESVVPQIERLNQRSRGVR